MSMGADKRKTGLIQERIYENSNTQENFSSLNEKFFTILS
jgi:hypothetical protein